jgi:hypothetical protein
MGGGGIGGAGGTTVVGAGAGGGVGPQARQAVLQIASDARGGGGALFMTTLSLDILHPRGLEHRRSVMQLVAFLIRKVGVWVWIFWIGFMRGGAWWMRCECEYAAVLSLF